MIRFLLLHRIVDSDKCPGLMAFLATVCGCLALWVVA